MMTDYLAQKHDVHLGDKRVGRELASRSLPATPRSEKNKYFHVVKPDPLPRRLFQAQNSHGSKREVGDVWSNTRSRH